MSTPSSPSTVVPVPESGESVTAAGLDVLLKPATVTFGVESRLAPVDEPLTQKMTVKNNQSYDVFVFISSIVDPQVSFKYSFVPSQRKPFLVKAGTEEKITLTLNMLCSTKVIVELAVKTWPCGATAYKQAVLPCAIETQESMYIDPDQLKKEKQIGRGGFGVVFAGSFHDRAVAIKEVLNQDFMTDLDRREFLKEVGWMEKLHHDCIVEFLGAVLIPNRLCIVSELCRYGSFQSAMEKYPKEFTESLKVKCLVNCASAMMFLHNSGIIHRDLKPENLLMVSLDPNDAVVAKLSDFGTTRQVKKFSIHLEMTKGVGTPLFMAPEIIAGSTTYNKSVDVYSFSYIMYVCYSGKLPFEGDPTIKKQWDLPNAIQAGKRPEVPLSMPEGMKNLMVKSWSAKVSKRPSFDELHKYLVKYFEELRVSTDNTVKTRPESPSSGRFNRFLTLSRRKDAKKKASQLLEAMPELETSWKIKWNKENGPEFEQLCMLLKMNEIPLADLSLRESKIDDKGAKHLNDILKHNAVLTSLDLSKNVFGDEGVKLIFEGLKTNCGITSLNIGENKIGEGISGLTKMLKSNSTITELKLAGVTLGAKGAVVVSDAMRSCSSLRLLDISDNKIGEEGTMMVTEALKVNSTLTCLDVSGNALGQKGARMLSESLKINKTINSLNCGHNKIGDDGAEVISEALKKNSCLTRLNLEYNGIGPKGLGIICETMKSNTVVKSLSLCENKITVEGAKMVSEMLAVNSTLLALDIDRNYIGHEGVGLVAESLKTNTTLTSVNMLRTNAGTEGAKKVGEVLKVNATLKELFIGYNEIGDEGATAICNALRSNSILKTLDMRINGIGDDGAKAISDLLIENKNLATLGLMSNCINVAGGAMIADALKQNSTLTKLDLKKNWLGESTMKFAKLRESNTTLTKLGLDGTENGEDD